MTDINEFGQTESQNTIFNLQTFPYLVRALTNLKKSDVDTIYACCTYYSRQSHNP
jgi:hypothetical protein